MMRQVSRPVRRGAGRKGRKDLARSLPYYDTEHVPNILKAPGVHGCTRYRLESTNAAGLARYAAVYDIDSPDVPSSAGWLAESEKGAWPTKIRPHTTNRSHSIFKRLT